jgi:HPP family
LHNDTRITGRESYPDNKPATAELVSPNELLTQARADPRCCTVAAQSSSDYLGPSSVPAHITAALVGVGAFLIFGEGYLSGAVAMGLTITLLILFGIMHPPAVSTSLIFAFRVQEAKTLLVFLMALAMVAVLYVIHRVALALLHRIVPGS